MADYKIVPVEPTEGMLSASSRGDKHRAGVYWRKMIATAPSAADDEALVRRVRTALEPFCYDGAQAFELAITAIRAIEKKLDAMLAERGKMQPQSQDYASTMLALLDEDRKARSHD